MPLRRTQADAYILDALAARRNKSRAEVPEAATPAGNPGCGQRSFAEWREERLRWLANPAAAAAAELPEPERPNFEAEAAFEAVYLTETQDLPLPREVPVDEEEGGAEEDPLRALRHAAAVRAAAGAAAWLADAKEVTSPSPTPNPHFLRLPSAAY